MDIFQVAEKSLLETYEGWDGVEQFKGTGERLKRLMGEMFWTNERIEESLVTCFSAVYRDAYKEMLMEGPIQVWTLCPHHLLPCLFTVHIGYIPNGNVLGLSKFSRVATILGKRPVMQEMYSRELAEAIWEGLKPEGLGVRIKGEHGCMKVRGVRQDGISVVTSNLKGTFLEQPEVRLEFFGLVNG